MSGERSQPLANSIPDLLTATIHLKICIDERPKQPSPDRTLVIRTVSCERITLVRSTVPGIGWRETPQAIRSKQFSFDRIDNGFSALPVHHGMEQTDSKNLIRPHGCIRRAVGDSVIKTATFFIPKQNVEAGLY